MTNVKPFLLYCRKFISPHHTSMNLTKRLLIKLMNNIYHILHLSFLFAQNFNQMSNSNFFFHNCLQNFLIVCKNMQFKIFLQSFSQQTAQFLRLHAKTCTILSFLITYSDPAKLYDYFLNVVKSEKKSIHTLHEKTLSNVNKIVRELTKKILQNLKSPLLDSVDTFY